MKPLTLQEAKDKIAERHGFENCDDMKKRWGNVPERISDEAAELYAQSQVNDALDQAIFNIQVRSDIVPFVSKSLIEGLKRLKR